jgi:hypothetical protein
MPASIWDKAIKAMALSAHFNKSFILEEYHHGLQIRTRRL